MANATTPRPTLAAAGSRSPAASAYACKRESPPWCSHRPVQYEIHLLTSPAATDYTGEIAIVQASNFSTLFVLSREQHLDETVLDAWIERAGRLGSNLDEVIKTDQSNCAFV
ncbi:apolipoprotein D and lipocalin family protein [Microdochium nivale]|nr:apolipoprotein D and lipocalin family protein [Microdochium nivale]